MDMKIYDKLDILDIKDKISDCRYKKNIIIYETIDSTNNEAKNLAENFAEEGTVIISDHQSSGKGRFNREFFSPSQKGIYMSIILRPHYTPPEKAYLITIYTAVNIANIFNKIVNAKVNIKWINDILINNKKVCGILAESSINVGKHCLDYIIVGIGINVFTLNSEFPDNIKLTSTSLIENNSNFVSRNYIISEIINSFSNIYEEMQKKEIIDKYISYLDILGKHINILDSSYKCINVGKVIDIDKNANLIVKDINQNIITLNSNDITIREIDDNL